MDTLHPIQIARFREMSFQEKYQISLGMLRVAREARFQAWRRRHPDWSDAQCLAAVAKEFIHGRP